MDGGWIATSNGPSRKTAKISVLCSDGIVPDDYERSVSEVRDAVTEWRDADFWQHHLRLQQTPKVSVLPVKSTGAHGDSRTYGFPACLDYGWEWDEARACASWYAFSYIDMERRSVVITERIPSVNRCVVELYRRILPQDGHECIEPSLSLQEGTLTEDRLGQTRKVGDIVVDTLGWRDLHGKFSEHLTINLPYATQKDHCSIVLMPVRNENAMTARFPYMSMSCLAEIVDLIVVMCPYVDAIYYDVTNKPPATFGWK